MAKIQEKPNVLIYFMDELRADVLGCYGHPFVQTPSIDRIAAEGVRFDSAYSNCPLCMPARNCFFTGKYPTEHGVTSNGPADKEFPELAKKYSEDPPTYAFGRVLRAAGYETIAGVGKHHTGFSPEISGFTEYQRTPDRRGAGPARLPDGADPEKSRPVIIPGEAPNTIIGGTYDGDAEDTHAAHTIDRALEWLKQAPGEEPWVLRVSINTPHTPVLPPAPYDSMYEDHVQNWQFSDKEFAARSDILRRWSNIRGFQQLSLEEQRRARSSYFGLTTFLDSQIARLEQYLEQSGLNDNLLTIFVADHGSSIGEHGLQVKGPFDTDDIAHIPLIFRWPGHIEPATSPALVQLIDTLPTLAELTRVPIPSGCSGLSLMPLLEANETSLHDAIFAEGDFPHCNVNTGLRETIRTRDWLYTRYPELGEEELFDLNTDPDQTRNVADERADVLGQLTARLDSWRESIEKE
ncbi:MAG: sulfatase-like hydrolase/transferase [Planctomycetes bacterium]|nr:sulfatase-like hydrolase/transferase [Planctomycetota bacterium]